MKKFFGYTGFAVLSLIALVMIGVGVVSFMSARLDISNERLDAREEERSAIEDHWIAAHRGELEQSFVHIEEVIVSGNTGTIEWEGSGDASGTVHFTIDSDGAIAYLDNISEFPEYPSYPKYFRDAINTKLN